VKFLPLEVAAVYRNTRRGGPEQILEDRNEEPLFMYSKLRRKHT
jgi:hypothetical protein